MNTQLVTTGLKPLTINSNDTILFQPFANGVIWDLTGGSATLRMVDPNGMVYAYPASIVGPAGAGIASYPWTVIAPPGDWRRAWDVTNAQGIRQVTLPLAFEVVASP